MHETPLSLLCIKCIKMNKVTLFVIRLHILGHAQLFDRHLNLIWLQLTMHFVTRTMPINEIDGKSHKTELKSSRKYSTNHIKVKSCH